jgi:hypothetical protein
MSAKLKKYLFLFSATLATASASAQALDSDSGPRANQENSPYSRYGIGDLSRSNNALIRGFGGAATAYIDPFSVNSFNPASYSFIKSTSLDFALEGRRRSVFLGDKNVSSGTATLSYLNIGIPLGKYAGMNIGFKPLSKMYYNANDTMNLNGIGRAISNYSGSGGMQYAYLGAAGQYKGFSIGFNAGYAFGSFEYNSSLQTLGMDSSGAAVNALRSAQFTHTDYVGGLYWKGGLIYHAVFKKDHFFNAGAAVTLSQQLNVKRNTFNLAYDFIGTGPDQERIVDTLQNTVDERGRLQMPAEYAFGLAYGRLFHWNIAADMVYNDFSNFEKMNDRTGVAENAWQVSLGGEVTPNPDATMKKYFSIVTYRLGFYYGKDYLNVNNTDINYVGGTIGASFPLKRNYNNFGRIHTALDIGQRGTIANGLARELIVKFTFGVSLNDIWFIKRKFH